MLRTAMLNEGEICIKPKGLFLLFFLDLLSVCSTDEMSSTTGNKNGAQNGNPPNGNGQANANGHGNGKGKGLEIPKLNASIAYYNSKLGNVRINA